LLRDGGDVDDDVDDDDDDNDDDGFDADSVVGFGGGDDVELIACGSS